MFLYENLFKLEIDSNEKSDNEDRKIELDIVNKANEINKDFYNKDISSQDFLNNNNCQNSLNPESIRKTNKLNHNFKLKDIIINKDIQNLINYKKKKKEPVIVKSCERYCYVNCCCYNMIRQKNKNYNLRYELMNNVETEIDNRFDIIKVFKLLNEFYLLKMLLLNETQCYLLKNREVQTITNNKSTPTEIIEDLNEVKEKQKINKLINYLKTKKHQNSFSNIDLLLLKFLNDDLKIQLKKDVEEDFF